MVTACIVRSIFEEVFKCSSVQVFKCYLLKNGPVLRPQDETAASETKTDDTRADCDGEWTAPEAHTKVPSHPTFSLILF